MIQIGDFKITRHEKKVIKDILKSNRITEGRYSRQFEKDFAEYIGTKYCNVTNSGSGALLCLLLSLKNHSVYKKNKGKYILTNALNYVATANAIELAGFEPIFIDNGCNIDKEVKDIDKNKIFAVLHVHLMGQPFFISKVKSYCEVNNIVYLEDSAQAHGSIYSNKKVGSFGLASIYSFYIAHNIQAGELGCICTSDTELNVIIRKMKVNGRICSCDVCIRDDNGCPVYNDIEPKFTHQYISSNFKTTDVSSALALVQLKNAYWIKMKRYENVKYLNNRLNDINWLTLPTLDANVSYLAYYLIIKDGFRLSRNEVCKYLEKKGIETRPLFSCIPLHQPAYKKYKKKYQGKLPISESLGNNGFYIGCHQYITKRQLDYIIKIMRSV
jgi:CDP-6-deoxy-D-xylo-4-hexulose-3-dehydrase